MVINKGDSTILLSCGFKPFMHVILMREMIRHERDNQDKLRSTDTQLKDFTQQPGHDSQPRY